MLIDRIEIVRQKKILLVIYSLLVINILMDLQIYKTCQKKLLVLFRWYLISKFNISLTGKPYVISSIFLFFY